MAQIKVGDRVRAVRDIDTACTKDLLGVVETLDEDSYGVRFDRFGDGHSLNKEDDSVNGWYCLEEDLELISTDPAIIIVGDAKQITDADIVITSSGRVIKCRYAAPSTVKAVIISDENVIGGK